MIVIKDMPLEWDRTKQEEHEIDFSVSNDVAAREIRNLLMNMDYDERAKWIMENSLDYSDDVRFK